MTIRGCSAILGLVAWRLFSKEVPEPGLHGALHRLNGAAFLMFIQWLTEAGMRYGWCIVMSNTSLFCYDFYD